VKSISSKNVISFESAKANLANANLKGQVFQITPDKRLRPVSRQEVYALITRRYHHLKQDPNEIAYAMRRDMDPFLEPGENHYAMVHRVLRLDRLNNVRDLPVERRVIEMPVRRVEERKAA